MKLNKKKNRVVILYGHSRNSGGVVNIYNKFDREMRESKYEIYHIRVGRIHRFKIFNFLLFRIIDLVFNYVKFIVELILIRPAIIHLNLSLNKKSIYRDFVYLMISRVIIRKIKILMHIHGWEENLALDLKSKKFFNNTFRKMAERANIIIVLASQFKECMLDVINSPQKIVVMPTTVDVNSFQAKLKSNSKYTFNILFLSRIIRNKGIFEIVDNIENIMMYNQPKKIMFIFAGDGIDKRSLEKYVIDKKLENHVEFTGYVRGKEKANLFKKSDIFIFPSYHAEGCPVAVLEAMASGLPVISTDVGALREIIIDDVNGIIISKQSVEQITEAINTLINNNELRVKISKNNRKKAESEFDVPIIFKKIESIYDNLIES